MTVVRYLLSRTICYIAVIIVAVLFNFFIPRLAPGDPIESMVARMMSQGSYNVDLKELVQEYKHMFGLDQDMTTQFVSYLRELLRGNLGYSITVFPATVQELILNALPWTIGLLSVVTLISWTLGTFLGAVSGWRGRTGKLHQVVNSLALSLYAIPYWLMAIILIFTLAYTLGNIVGSPVFPLSGGYTRGMAVGLTLDFAKDVIWHATLPALSIVMTSLGWWYLTMRSMITDLKGEDFIAFAEAKGLSQKQILWKYAFRNALLPQVTGLALSLGNMVGGAIVMESIFAYPGLGWLLYHAVISQDFPLIQGITLLITISVTTATLLIDLIYVLIDPRIKYGE